MLGPKVLLPLLLGQSSRDSLWTSFPSGLHVTSLGVKVFLSKYWVLALMVYVSLSLHYQCFDM